ncbi:hypothetical protein QTG54_000074 [Skeletonema marinoi]|uniref:Nuclease associated modular domain-containing protein n=1 Tax=Skeletonema marinoi TaxID=267567 RepID=A0AAD8YMN3_9STRA|nr:hypothetical protein QTG54_000074 [Skeletonema marinoi]
MTSEMMRCITDVCGCYHHKQCTKKSGNLSRRISAVTMLSLMICMCGLNACSSPMLVGAFSSWTTARHKSQRNSESQLQSFGCNPSHDFSGRRRSNYIASIVLCRSTISDETETTTFQINGAASDALNGAANGATNGASNGLSNGAALNGASLNGAALNGVSNGASLTNGLHVETETHNGQADNNINQEHGTESSDEEDVPLPTVNGGYSHTSASKAKISAANKGKTPWNKGKTRSEEVKARIAEGVRRKNRERFLAKLAEEGITEEEFNERRKAERRKKDAERRARKTAKGGYTPTEETKKKISNILKEKYANGEIKRKPRDPSTIRKGFKHSEETKQKIRESLKRKWAEDSEYRELMTNKTVASGVVGESVRKRIAETLKQKWEDPEFRASMMEKFKKRKTSSGARGKAHREKISAAMKKKWMDEEYRKRATDGMAKGREKMSSMVREAKPLAPKKPKLKKAAAVTKGKLTSVQPLTKVAGKKTATKRKKRTTKKKSAAKEGDVSLTAVKPITTTPKKSTVKEKPKEPEPDGSISRLREERRDLYDLLYGDEEDDDDDHTHVEATPPTLVSPPPASPPTVRRTPKTRRKAEETIADREDPNHLGSSLLGGGSISSLLEDDDDLDDFDPYGLSNY